MKNEKEKNTMDQALRRMGGILASPSLVMSYEHTTPLLERAWLRRLGLTKQEATDFLEQLCCHGLLDEGAKAVVYDLCLRQRIRPEEAVRLLLAGEGWPAAEEDASQKI